jgi:glycosyltransferase involved in cell wall biosynthesis
MSGVERPVVVLVLHAAHDDGGMERVFAELIRRAHRDYRLIVISRDLATDLRPLVDWWRVRVPARPMPLRFSTFYVLAGLRLARLRADIVHTLGAVVPNRADLASVHFCHAGFRAAGRPAPSSTASLARHVNTRIAWALGLGSELWSYGRGRIPALAAVSTGVARELEHHYPRARVVVTPNGVDLDRFRPNPVARASLRRAEGTDSEVVALFVGGDWERKGLPVAIEALGCAARRAPDTPLRLWVVGGGNEGRFRGLAAEAGAERLVRFFGRQRDTERYYQAADVFVLPSAYEAFPLAGLEAAASGLPLVTTRLNGIEELVGEDAGIIVERTPEAFAAALEKLASDSARRARMGQAARRRASEYTWERSTSSVLELYRDLLGNGRVPKEVAA